jgi:hypothetical protein
MKTVLEQGEYQTLKWTPFQVFRAYKEGKKFFFAIKGEKVRGPFLAKSKEQAQSKFLGWAIMS